MLVSLKLRKRGVERFENGNGYSDVYGKLHDIVYNFEPMYKNQADIIKKKTNLRGRDVKVLDAGVKSGHFARYFKDLPRGAFVGVDRNQTLLDNARVSLPLGNFIKGNILNSKLFEPLEFTHIIALDETIYRYQPKDRKIIMKNFYNWLKPNGWLVMHVIEDPTEYNPAPREFTMYTEDPENPDQIHAITHFKSFSHDVTWKPDVEKGRLDIHEKYEFSKDKVHQENHTLWMDENVLPDILEAGFTLKEIVESKVERFIDELYLFQKII